jgi:hypothetical protein
MKFLTSNCWQSAACLMATAGLMHCQYYHNMYSYNESTESHSPVYSAVCSRCMKWSIINFCSWVFGTLEFRWFSLWKPIWGGKHTKSILGNSEYSFHHFSSFKMNHVWELKKSLPTPMLASRKLYYICCNTIYRNVRPLSLLCDLVWFSIALPVL